MPHWLEPPYRFFIDECLGLHDVPNAIEGALAHDESLTRFTEMFARGTRDDVWLRRVGAEGLVIITKDDRLRFRPNERAALIEANVAAFMVSSGTGRVMAEKLVRAIPTMRRVLRGQRPPLVGRVLNDGRISLHIVNGETTNKIVKLPMG